jgi:hypothetical protein
MSISKPELLLPKKVAIKYKVAGEDPVVFGYPLMALLLSGPKI